VEAAAGGGRDQTKVQFPGWTSKSKSKQIGLRALPCHHLIGSLIILARGFVRRSKVGLDLDLVATKHWLTPINKADSGTFALKTCCREVQFQAVVFSVVYILKLVSFTQPLNCKENAERNVEILGGGPAIFL
jgi:hypothetical protein